MQQSLIDAASHLFLSLSLTSSKDALGMFYFNLPNGNCAIISQFCTITLALIVLCSLYIILLVRKKIHNFNSTTLRFKQIFTHFRFHLSFSTFFLMLIFHSFL